MVGNRRSFDVEIPEKETEETEVEPEQEVNEAEQRQKELKEIIEEYNQQKQDPDYYYLPDQWDGQKTYLAEVRRPDRIPSGITCIFLQRLL